MKINIFFLKEIPIVTSSLTLEKSEHKESKVKCEAILFCYKMASHLRI
ncbi:MAG: hypothetical protein ACI81G_001955, partial [Gammaproteobacteria bacterium]